MLTSDALGLRNCTNRVQLSGAISLGYAVERIIILTRRSRLSLFVLVSHCLKSDNRDDTMRTLVLAVMTFRLARMRSKQNERSIR